MFEKINNKFCWLILFLILALSFVLMLWASSQESATMDELAHIPAGYSYVKFLDYRLNPEHPPLLKVLSAIPLLFLNLNFPIQNDAWQKYVNGQWDVGREFLYESGNDADLIIQWSRIGPMILTLLLILLIYIWSKEIVGRWWALVVATLFGLSPNVLAHGHLVTTDIASAFGVVLALYFFVKFLYIRSRKYIILAGIAFGVAQLLKFSTFILIPYFLFLTIVFWWANFKKPNSILGLKNLWLYILKTILVFIVGYVLVVYPVYTVFTWNYPISKQISDTEFILTSFAGGPPQEGKICNPIRCLAELNIWLTKNYITRPFAHYLLGVLMVMQRGTGGNTAYFMGEVSASGWKLYFPTVYILKEPIPFLIMILIALIVWFKKIILNFKKGLTFVTQKFIEYLNLYFEKFSMIGFIILYWTLSIVSPLNIGFRHLFPTLPLIYILTISSLRSLTFSPINQEQCLIKKFFNTISFLFKSFLKYIFIFILLIWFGIEVIISAPYFLSYFNEFGGGIWNGYRFVVDSNYDWGQDLLRLKKFVEENNISKIAIDYFGGGNPKYYLKDKAEYWWSARGNPVQYNIEWLAVSVNTLAGAMGKLHPGHQRNLEDEYGWLKEVRSSKMGLDIIPLPDFRAGTSIFIYHLK